MPKTAPTFPVRGVPGGWRDAWSAPDAAAIAQAQFAAWDTARAQRDAAVPPPGDAPQLADRHMVVGIGQPTDDPAQHRAFTLRARFDAAAGGWMAQVAEQNHNDQSAAWTPIAGDAAPRGFPTAAACLGAAVTRLIAAVDQDAAAAAPPS